MKTTFSQENYFFPVNVDNEIEPSYATIRVAYVIGFKNHCLNFGRKNNGSRSSMILETKKMGH